LIVAILFSGFFWLYEVRYNVSRAGITSYSFSIDNSYLFVTPLRARANSQEKVRITAFVLNNQGLGVMGKKVFVSADPNLAIESIQGLTDAYGKAFFDVSASKGGEYYLEITVDDAPLKQKAHLSFY
jgi:hypothetical protein